MKIRVAVLEAQVQDIEQYSRRDNVEIVGVPYSPKENIYSILEGISKLLDIRHSSSEVSIAHRLPDKKGNGKPNIIVKFVNRYIKDDWINAAKKSTRLTAAELSNSWPSTSIYINDHLTYSNKRLLAYLRDLLKQKKIVNAWSRDCRVLMRVRAEGRVFHVKTMEDVEKALSA